jgi:hypothetical protein
MRIVLIGAWVFMGAMYAALAQTIAFVALNHRDEAWTIIVVIALASCLSYLTLELIRCEMAVIELESMRAKAILVLFKKEEKK